MSRVVRPETVTIQISQGDRIVLAKRLTAGQELDLFERAVKRMGPTGPIEYSPAMAQLTKMIAYLVNWTIADDAGHVIPILDQPPDVVEAALRRLDGDSFREIRDVINKHDLAMAEEIAAQKKILIGGGVSSPSTVSAG